MPPANTRITRNGVTTRSNRTGTSNGRVTRNSLSRRNSRRSGGINDDRGADNQGPNDLGADADDQEGSQHSEAEDNPESDDDLLSLDPEQMTEEQLTRFEQHANLAKRRKAAAKLQRRLQSQQDDSDSDQAGIFSKTNLAALVYKGKTRQELIAFLAQLKTRFDLARKEFKTDYRKVAYATACFHKKVEAEDPTEKDDQAQVMFLLSRLRPNLRKSIITGTFLKTRREVCVRARRMENCDYDSENQSTKIPSTNSKKQRTKRKRQSSESTKSDSEKEEIRKSVKSIKNEPAKKW
ncbi:hypothetical protein F4861DRAFT_540177 [Xylaria intraflava]|nr:hypothetical protein F4861DRAFT_540177 [Xylaria intraflava]